MSTTTARQNMVDGQLRPNKVNSPALLATFALLAREDFAPAQSRNLAYLDQPTPLGEGREMYSPLVAARLLQELALAPNSSVLILAGGTGYSAAVLAELGHRVTLVEDNPVLRAEAAINLALNRAVAVVEASPATYAPTQSFDAILIDTPYEILPNLAALTKHLKPGGKIAGVRIGADGLPEAVVQTLHGNTLMEDVLFETKGTPHPALTAATAFVF